MPASSMNIAFRADASPGIGIGHVMRCLSLADELARMGARCSFICASVVGMAQARIAAHGHELIRLPEAPQPAREAWQDDADATAAALAGRRVDWLVADHYGLDVRWESRTRPLASCLAVIDDLADRRHDADLLLNQNAGATASAYQGLIPTGCSLLLGPMNALLAPGFALARGRKSAAGAMRQGLHLVITMGGTDPRGATLRAIEALEQALPATARVTVVLGSSSAIVDDAKKKAAASDLDIRLALDVEDMAALLASADIAIAAAGSTLWELCCLAVPTIAVITADNQQRTASTLAALGAVLLIDGPELLRSALPPLLATLLDDATRHQLAGRAGSVTDGLGSGRVAAMMAGRTREVSLPSEG